MSWTEAARDGRARAGTFSTPHGEVPTPNFLPVGTRASVKALDSADVRQVGAAMVLANTYHLMLRPGHELIASLGGLHEFMGWDGPILTDSGGYQVFSLNPKVTEDGVTFRSTYDGASVHLTPEGAVAVQENLGADVAMQLDELVGLPAPREVVEGAMRRSLRWAERSFAIHRRADQYLFPIVQGGTDEELRAESARTLAALSPPGFGVGGLSVGESGDARNRALRATVAELPADRVRYVMGLGDTEGVLEAIAHGIDLFDCVWPTRLARHGKVLSAKGDFSMRANVQRNNPDPIDPDCACHTCRHHSRAYLRHLVTTKELAAHRLISIHNLFYTLSVMAGARRAIETGTFESYRHAVGAARSRAGSEAVGDDRTASNYDIDP